MPDFLVINPNSNEQVTENLRESLREFRPIMSIECHTTAGAPFGIESDADVELAASLVIEQVASEQHRDAIVIACYSDPGLAQCRVQFSTPIFGMQDSALRAAASGGCRFGVLALSDESIARHLPCIEALGLNDLLAAELPLNISVEQSAGDPKTLDKVIENGRRLIDEFGAEAVVLGCAGMAALQKPAEQALSVPVIEPAHAAVAEAFVADRATKGG
ncbi:MAG: aspartate/glutamate racemase family protein [Woeseiaceae bacterium]|nr:aspartate/glutamate racemase family protein [Woeseiaceae bacterium]